MVEYNLGKVRGEDGKGIESIVKTSTTDNIDTYTILYTNGEETTFTVTNGITPDTSTFIQKSEIVDNLTTDNSNRPLSARQGKILNDLIGSAIEYINR